MILQNRSFHRVEPARDAQKIYIFCEGKDREYNYFKYFEGLDTRLNLIVYELKGEEDNSPAGLFNLAQMNLIGSTVNPYPKYDFRDGFDQVWIVLDTDVHKNEHRKGQLLGVRKDCSNLKWHVAQSNPCFEVWLYFHSEAHKPDFDGIEVSKIWKQFVANTIKGGFNAKKHPALIPEAIKNAQQNFEKDPDGFPGIASTEVFMLGIEILKIGNIVRKIQESVNPII